MSKLFCCFFGVALIVLQVSCASRPVADTPVNSIVDDDFAGTTKQKVEVKKPPGLESSSKMEFRSAEPQGQAGYKCTENKKQYGNGEVFRAGCLVCTCTAGPRFSKTECKELKVCKSSKK